MRWISTASSLIKEASNQARAIALNVKRADVVEMAIIVAKTVYVKYNPVTVEYYNKYKPLAEMFVIMALCSLNRLPLFPQLSCVLVPTVAYCAQKYNLTIVYFTSRGYRVSYYVPLVPVDEIGSILRLLRMGTL